MLGSHAPLRGAALLLSISLLTQCRLHAASLPPGQDARPEEPRQPSPAPPAKEVRARALPAPSREGGDAQEEEDDDDELFRDVDPKALAAVLLQALGNGGHNSPDKRRAPDEERVQSQSRSTSLGAGRAREQQLEEEEEEEGRDSSSQELENLQALLRELRPLGPAAKRERAQGDAGHNAVLQELEEYERLRAGTKRRAPPAEPWAGARKLRQQQQLEHQLLQRRYEELAESRRQAEEARKAAAEEERLADMASDLLLQYLLKGREDEGEPGADAHEEEEEEEEEEGRFRGGRAKGSPLLFEDEEGNVAEDKRSDEEEEDDDIDPNTIDQLIELSTKLHLPAEDVIDIINDVEKKKKKASSSSAPKHQAKPPPYAPARPYYLAAPWRRPKPDERDWNEVLHGDDYLAPKRYLAKQHDFSNYIQPRAFQLPPPPSYPRGRHLPGSLAPRDEAAAAAGRAREDEMENYIEQVLMDHAQAFQ
ncbi:Neurosecretory protein VGF [Platysternon megacephalum]|uniref:Neurosecretory protein VGF n=1 Tax=Platysternon megacephalum TaxID=55544 RepID=A0A4D9DHQ9_9SAUR|nr:Neurosecretory protein VGF [Platysternon megacephalum]